MLRHLALAIAALALMAAAAPWQWSLPVDVRPPRIPAGNPMSAAKVELGRRLFYDADLSIDGTMACATCHEQHRAFADGNPTHGGVHGDPGRRNVPGLANVGWMTALTWANPHLASLEVQAVVPVTGTMPVEMGMAGHEAEIGRRLAKDSCYRTMFAEAFPGDGAIDFGRVVKALAAFERSMVSFDSSYDAWMQGNKAALSAEAIKGVTLFRRNCKSCHSGSLLSDRRFHALLPPSNTDPGLQEITHKASDIGRFRTPSLRNVALTAPYFHDGSAPSIAVAIRRHPGMTPLSDSDIGSLSAFTTTLTDEHFTKNERFSLPDQACGKRL